MGRENTDEIRKLREFLENFSEEKLKPKLEEQQKKLEKTDSPAEKENIEQKIESLRDDYQRENWLASAAKRAGWISLATHVSKYTHPMSKASAVYYIPDNKADIPIGTHSLKRISDDVYGNAAALDVFGFLSREYNGRTVLQIAEEDPELLASAMSEDSDAAMGWIEDLLSVKELKSPASHTLMKQLYFPLESGEYHLVSPVFSSSMVHEVYEHIRRVRFSEETKEARQARRKNEHSEHGYSEYTDTAVTAYGGTKPQNISQLNSTRHGENILLFSGPPQWRSKEVRPVNEATVFRYRFGSHPFVRELLRNLEGVVRTWRNDMHVRQESTDIRDALAVELYNLYEDMQQLSPGWSRSADCRLNRYEKLWLDPPQESDAEYENGEWCTEVADRFAGWLCDRIERVSGAKTEPAYRSEFRKAAEKTLNEIREENCYG